MRNNNQYVVYDVNKRWKVTKNPSDDDYFYLFDKRTGEFRGGIFRDVNEALDWIHREKKHKGKTDEK